MKSTAVTYTNRQLKQAIEWFVRLESETCSQEDQSSFDSWLAKSESHRLAYRQAQRIWQDMDDLKMLPLPDLAMVRSVKPKKSIANVAVLLFATIVLSYVWQEWGVAPINYTTGFGEHRRIELADQSQIDLNSNSRIALKYSLFQRRVQLIQGEALFTVRHDQLRPFVVQAGAMQIRDVGTRFNVLSHHERLSITVLEGEVELNDGKWANHEHLLAGQQRRYSQTAGLGSLETVGIEPLAWLNGQLVFKRTPLKDVVAEMERYHPVRFRFADPALAKQTLTGNFNALDLGPFLHALESIMSVSVQRKDQDILLRKAQKH